MVLRRGFRFALAMLPILPLPTQCGCAASPEPLPEPDATPGLEQQIAALDQRLEVLDQGERLGGVWAIEAIVVDVRENEQSIVLGP